MALCKASKDGTSQFMNCMRLKQSFELLDKPVLLCNKVIHTCIWPPICFLLSFLQEEDNEGPFVELEEDENEPSENEIVMEDC